MQETRDLNMITYKSDTGINYTISVKRDREIWEKSHNCGTDLQVSARDVI